MAGINHLKEVRDKRGDDFLNSLLNNYVIINEKVDGTFFGVKKTKGDQFKYFKKSGEISYVDRVLMKYYNPVISYFESIPLEKRQRIPANFFFGFEYLTKKDAAASRYSRLPKNGLVLSYIHKLDDSGNVVATVQTKEHLDRWADYLDVEQPPIIFEGKLDDEQRTEILEFAYSPTEKLYDKFKTKSFTKYIISVLNKGYESAFLKNTKDSGIEGIVFRFYDQNSANPEANVFLAKIVDPLFQAKVKEGEPARKNSSQDYIWLIVIDLMNHFEMYDTPALKEMVSAPGSFEEKYTRLVNSIFKDFIKEYSGKYAGLQLEVPEYLNRPEFGLDLDMIEDSEVKRLIQSDETYAEIYKILLNFFRKSRKKSSSGFFTNDLLTQLNLIVAKIRNVIMGDEIYESLFPSFSEFVGSTNEEYGLSEKEAAEESSKKVKAKEVNVLIGSFQPVSLGHVKAAKKLKEKNGLPCVFIAIKPATPNAKSPFTPRLTKVLLEKVQQEFHQEIIDVKMIDSGQIEEVVGALVPEYEPVLWGTTERRVKDFALQLDYIKKRNIPIRLSANLKLIELPVFVRSEDVMSAIKSSDFAEFKKLVPTSVASEFFNLQKELSDKVNETTSLQKIFESAEISVEIEDPKLREVD